MAELIPNSAPMPVVIAGRATSATRPGVMGVLTDPSAGPLGERLRNFVAQPAIRRALPTMAGIGALGVAAALWLAMSEAPQRMLYSGLSDAERAEVVAALDKAGVDYQIDNASGTLTVGEDDLYKARMIVASDGALAAPESATDMLDSIPLGASRTIEGERVRNVRERELVLTIMEIDGVEAVRVHLATPERTVFVREQAPPSASVMIRLARGRSLSPDQVVAIGNLVAASVPGLAVQDVRIVDQHGKLLSQEAGGAAEEGLEMQRRFEEKLRGQVAQLLAPIVGESNFSTQVQVELDRSEVTTAEENYDKDGALRSESEARSQQMGPGAAGGIPGVLANTPPPPTDLVEGAPMGDMAGGEDVQSGESSANRTYELGRQVSVASTQPGGVRRLSVAVALSAEALAKAKPASVQQIEQLVAAAVGADPARGDRVAVIASAFDPVITEPPPFYETSWFATILRHAVALVAVILALLFGVRPLVRALKPSAPGEADGAPVLLPSNSGQSSDLAILDDPGAPDPLQASLREQIGLARQLASERPDHAAQTIRRMLAPPAAGVA